MRLLTLALATAAAMPWAAPAAATPEVTVTLGATPTQLRVGEVTRLEVSVRARGGRIQKLDLSDLEKYPELEIISRQTVRPMQFSFGFGSKVQKESSITNIFVLRPTIAGTFEFAPAVAKVDGEIYRSGPSCGPSWSRRRSTSGNRSTSRCTSTRGCGCRLNQSCRTNRRWMGSGCTTSRSRACSLRRSR